MLRHPDLSLIGEKNLQMVLYVHGGPRAIQVFWVPMYLVCKLTNFEVRMLLVKDLAASSVTSRMSHNSLVQHANILALILKLFRTSSITPPQSTSLALCLLSASPCDCFHNRRHNQKFIVWNSLYTASSGYYNTGTLSVLVCLLPCWWACGCGFQVLRQLSHFGWGSVTIHREKAVCNTKIIANMKETWWKH